MIIITAGARVRGKIVNVEYSIASELLSLSTSGEQSSRINKVYGNRDTTKDPTLDVS